MQSEITNYITPSGHSATIIGPRIKYSETLNREIAYQGYYNGYLDIPHTHIITKQISNHVRNVVRELTKLQHRFCFEQECEICKATCEKFGGCDEKYHGLIDEYERTNLVNYFSGGISYAEEFDGYDRIGFDTNHYNDEHIKIGDPVPSEIRADIWEEMLKKPGATCKTKNFVIDCLNRTSKKLAKYEHKNQEFWKALIIKYIS